VNDFVCVLCFLVTKSQLRMQCVLIVRRVQSSQWEAFMHFEFVSRTCYNYILFICKKKKSRFGQKSCFMNAVTTTQQLCNDFCFAITETKCLGLQFHSLCSVVLFE